MNLEKQEEAPGVDRPLKGWRKVKRRDRKRGECPQREGMRSQRRLDKTGCGLLGCGDG